MTAQANNYVLPVFLAVGFRSYRKIIVKQRRAWLSLGRMTTEGTCLARNPPARQLVVVKCHI